MSIKTDCKAVFSLENVEFDILSNIAKYSETWRKDIHLANLSQKQTERKVEKLADKGFLQIVQSIPYRNMKKKNEKKFGLTLKGFLASVTKTNLQENYLVRRYLSQIKDVETKQALLSYIDVDIRLFFLVNKNIGITLEKMQEIDIWIEDYNNLERFLKRDTEQVTKLEQKIEEAEKLIISKNIPFEKRLENLITVNYDYWYDVISLFAKEDDIEKITNELEKKNKKISDEEFMRIGKDQFGDEATNKKIMYEMWRGWQEANSKYESK